MQPDTTMQDIVVTNCMIRTLCNGLKIGTDTAGNFQNIAMSNVVIRNDENDVQGAHGGVNLCALDGGFVRNVSVSNVLMQNVQCPFYLVSRLRERNQVHYRTPRAGRMEGIALCNIQAEASSVPAFVVGHDDEPIRNVSIANLRVNKTANACTSPPLAFRQRQNYPTPFMFGEDHRDHLPACGLYLRNVRRARLRDLWLDSAETDVRPTLAMDRTEDVTFDGTAREV